MVVKIVRMLFVSVRLSRFHLDRLLGRRNISFQDLHDNNEWNNCIDQNSLTLGRCIHACDSDGDCENNCVNEFKTRQIDCPCEVRYYIIHLDLSNTRFSNTPFNKLSCYSYLG